MYLTNLNKNEFVWQDSYDLTMFKNLELLLQELSLPFEPHPEESCPKYEPHHEKTNILVTDLVRHKPGCTATEGG